MCIYQINKACYIIYIYSRDCPNQPKLDARKSSSRHLFLGEHFQLLLCIIARCISSSHLGNDGNGIPALDIVKKKILIIIMYNVCN